MSIRIPLCSEIVFDDMVPIVGHQHFVRQDRFTAEDGWIIRVIGDSATLARPADDAIPYALGPFHVRGYAFAYTEAPIDVEAESDPFPGGHAYRGPVPSASELMSCTPDVQEEKPTQRKSPKPPK